MQIWMPKVKFKFLNIAPYGFKTNWGGLLVIAYMIWMAMSLAFQYFFIELF